MKMTFQPKKRQRSKVHGFRARMSSAGGRKVLRSQKSKRKKEIIRIGRSFVAFFSLSRKDWMQNEFFGKLEENQDFQSVYQKGRSYANKLLVMYVLENNMERNRLGISVSKKVGNSRLCVIMSQGWCAKATDCRRIYLIVVQIQQSQPERMQLRLLCGNRECIVAFG